jgi:hypothetical protein
VELHPAADAGRRCRSTSSSRPRSRLRAALAAALVPDNAPEAQLFRRWLDNWSGVGLVLTGRAHQGWDVQPTAYAARDWRATFYPVGIAPSIVGGTAWEPTPWRAVQQAAWTALKRPVRA